MKSILMSGGALRVSLALLVVLGLAGGAVVFLVGGSSHNHAVAHPAGEYSPEEQRIKVKAVRPHFDKSFSLDEKRPADVLPYYLLPLESRVAGTISMIQVDKGSVVKKGDTLIKISVPELDARVLEYQAAKSLAEAQVKQKKAGVDVAKANREGVEARIRALKAKLASDQSVEAFRRKQADRYARLFRDNAIDAQLVEEQEDKYVAAQQTVIATKEAILAEKAHLQEADAKVEQAEADFMEAERKVDVARAEVAHAKALVDFATITAPFDGEIVDRNPRVNTGVVVQNADSGNPEPLLTIQSKNLVRIVIRVPDNYAPYITPDTEAIFETPALPGLKIRGKVTRFPHSVQNARNDRTMPVEVDLWTGDPQELEKKKNDKEFRAGLRGGMPNDPDGGLPVPIKYEGKPLGGQQKNLLPGMFGQMTLMLRHFENVYLLPSSAIVMQGGQPYIYLVQDGKAHLQPVKIQVDDGKLVKVERLNAQNEVLGDLEGQEVVIVSNQGELSEGQPVDPTVVENWRTLAASGKKP